MLPPERFDPVSKFRETYLSDIWNVPNVLTLLRMALIPIFVVFYVVGWEKAALLIFLLASFTDWLDGHLARKHQQITAFGKLMDPLADKLMVCTALICQGVRGIFPWPAILIVMTKELVMIVGGTYMLGRGIVVYSNFLGKAAQFSFIIALIFSFWHREFVDIKIPLDRVFLWIAVVIALVALIEYTVLSLRKLRKAA